jgi:hypothetical protein
MQRNFFETCIIQKSTKPTHQSSIQIGVVLVSGLVDHIKISSKQPRTWT